MSRGKFAFDYFQNPTSTKPLSEIFADLNDYTGEKLTAQDAHEFNNVTAFVLLPPLKYGKTFVKGILLSNGIDVLVERVPNLKSYFHLYAYSMWNSLPWSLQSDVLCACYDNPVREKWFRETFPERAHQVLVPLQDGDIFDHYHLSPGDEAKDIDILCVGRIDPAKNIPMFGAALRRLHDKYPNHPRHAVLLSGMDVQNIEPWQKAILTEAQNNLGDAQHLLHVEPKPSSKILSFYRRAKVVVLCSLIEGKNRAIYEAMSVNVPVVTFQHYNQHARGSDSILPRGGGLTAPQFTADALADTLHTVLTNLEKFSPRRANVGRSGRVTGLEMCIDALPYYAKRLPGYERGHNSDNTWIDLAMQGTYGCSLHDHLFCRQGPGFYTLGMDDSASLLEKHIAKVANVAGGKAA